MKRGRAGVVSLVALGAFILACVPAAGAVIPLRGAYSGATAAGEPFSMVVATKKTGPKLRAEGVKRTARTSFVTGAVPISCNTGLSRSEEIGFPGPLGIRNGRFAVTGVGQGGIGDRVTTRVIGHFTGRRKASGTLTYSGGFDGEFCSGATTWTATRE